MERLPVRDPSPGEPRLLVTPAVLELVRRSASLPRGLGFVARAPVEHVASALGSTVPVVEVARACLGRAPERALLLDVHADARDRAMRTLASLEATAPPARGPEDVVHDAARHPLGIDFLMHGSFETVAITFGVHPDVVLAARGLVEAGLAGPGHAPAGPAPRS